MLAIVELRLMLLKLHTYSTLCVEGSLGTNDLPYTDILVCGFWILNRVYLI